MIQIEVKDFELIRESLLNSQRVAYACDPSYVDTGYGRRLAQSVAVVQRIHTKLCKTHVKEKFGDNPIPSPKPERRDQPDTKRGNIGKHDYFWITLLVILGLISLSNVLYRNYHPECPVKQVIYYV